MALIIDEDKGWEVFDGNFPHRLHPKFWKSDDLLLADVVLSEQGSWATGGAEVEAAVGLASRSHLG